jgi:hypothetical protein
MSTILPTSFSTPILLGILISVCFAYILLNQEGIPYLLSFQLLSEKKCIERKCSSKSMTKKSKKKKRIRSLSKKNHNKWKDGNSSSTRAPTNMRYAEKSRVATCRFADRVAQIVLDVYNTSCPADLQASYQQTVVAGFVIEDTSNSTLKCVALGVGTKYLHSNVIEQDCNDHRVRDSHAEILARHSLQHFFYTEIDNAILGQKVSIFETHSLFPDVPIGVSPFKLRQHLRLHFYSSSVPCGNASIKRWAHPKRPTQYPDLPSTEYPNEPHPPFYIMQPEQGQVALLVKRDHGTGSHEELADSCHPQIIATGTAPVNSGLGIIKTCSDKIAIWNAVGVQGCFLSCFVEPIYLHTCTIGRKFSLKTCQRALCCRISGFESVDHKFTVHHPSMLQSSIKFDNNFLVSDNPNKNERKKRIAAATDTGKSSSSSEKYYYGASFLEPRCFWWSSSGTSGSENEGDNDNVNSGIIDGTTGLVASSDQNTSASFSSAKIARINLLNRFRSTWLKYVKLRGEHGSDFAAILNSSYSKTKELCEKMSLTTYRQSKLKLLENFFKMK